MSREGNIVFQLIWNVMEQLRGPVPIPYRYTFPFLSPFYPSLAMRRMRLSISNGTQIFPLSNDSVLSSTGEFSLVSALRNQIH